MTSQNATHEPRHATLPGDRRRSPPFPRPLAAFLEPIYKAAIARRNRDFDRGKGVRRAPIPVVSVGNLSVGGTGKTPLVAWLCRTLDELGHTPGIAMRGYKAKPGQPSDEAREHAARRPGTPIRQNPDRHAAVTDLAERDNATVAVLDDGFQHRRLYRDLDIVLIDATRDPFADRCLPAGWLREPVSSLARAHAVIITRCELATHDAIARIEHAVERIAPSATRARAEHTWLELIDHTDATVPFSAVRKSNPVLACGIGHPAAFLAAANAAGITHPHTVVKHDHHEWNHKDATELCRLAGHDTPLLTTEKDWVKLAAVLPETLATRTLRPRLGITFTAGEPQLRSALGSVPRP